MKKLLLIANTRSGKASISRYISDMIYYYNSKQYEVVVYIPQYRGHAKEIAAQRGSEFDNIICCGGDGTLNEVVSGLMLLDKRPVLGYVPCGSTNDFANTAGISADIERAYKTALTGDKIIIDTGEINDRIFTYICAFGIFTNVSYETPQNMKNMLGHLAYVLEGMKQIANIPSYKIRVEYDDGNIEDEFVLGFVANSKKVGGFRIFSDDDIDLDDGLFEVILVKSIKNINDVRDFIACFLAAKFDRDLFYVFKTSHIRFISDDDVSWTVDGEYCGSFKEAYINNHHKTIEILK